MAICLRLQGNVCKTVPATSTFFYIGLCSRKIQSMNMESKDNVEDTQIIQEGEASIIAPASKNVFYNPVQEFNRDLSIAVLRVFAEQHFRNNSQEEKDLPPAGIICENGLRILEALAATGLRSIRYAKEIAGIKQIIANDLSENAVQSMNENIKHNAVQHLVSTTQEDATMVMYKHRQWTDRFDVVDLDPYGCASPFLDAAVQCIADGGILLVTCTDLAVLAGNSPETCYTKYGAVSLKIKSCHEMALRIVLQCIEAHANRYGRYIKPLLSVSADFYVRVFVKVSTSQAMCKMTTSKLSHVYLCSGCETFTLLPLGSIKELGEKPSQNKYSLPNGPPVGTTCEHCSHKFHIGGPIWIAPLHDLDFVSTLEEVVNKGIFKTQRRMQGLLAVIKEELPDVPLYYALDKLCSTVRGTTMSMVQFRSAILNSGYRVSYSHASRTSIKTDAPSSLIWDVIRTWVKKNPVRQDRLLAAGANILAKECTTDISFEIRSDANPLSRSKGLSRFPNNPEKFWGPGARSKAGLLDNTQMTKSFRNQGKKRKHSSDDLDKSNSSKEKDTPLSLSDTEKKQCN